MKKQFITLSGIIFLAFSMMANIVKAEDQILGSWIFSVTQAPWEYSRGKVIFEQGEDQDMKGKIVFDSGIELQIASVTRAEDKITFEVNVEGMPVRTVVTLKDDTITGFVETYEGNMPFAAKRHVPED